MKFYHWYMTRSGNYVIVLDSGNDTSGYYGIVFKDGRLFAGNGFTNPEHLNDDFFTKVEYHVHNRDVIKMIFTKEFRL